MNTMSDLSEPTNVRVGRKALAELAGVRDSTLKFYSEQGLLPYSQAGPGLARRYDRDMAIPVVLDGDPRRAHRCAGHRPGRAA
jgi:hypothetical protein